jgi:anthranilate synthase component 2
VHGKTSALVHDGTSIFTGLPSPIRVARYHSLVIGAPDVPPSLRVLATARDDHEVMAVEHREHRVVGVQFHPESAATEYGYAMLDRFLRGDRARLADVPARADGAPGTPPPVEDEPLRFVPPPVEQVR